jgi:hypothetical protein
MNLLPILPINGGIVAHQSEIPVNSQNLCAIKRHWNRANVAKVSRPKGLTSQYIDPCRGK